MENLKTGAVFYPTKSVGRETAKSAITSTLILDTLGYSLVKLTESAAAQELRLKPRVQDIPLMALGAGIGLLYGADKAKRTRIYNARANVINKHADDPAAQREAIVTMGTPENFKYQAGLGEKLFNLANLLSFVGLIAVAPLPLNQAGKRLAQGMLASTALTFAGREMAHGLGMKEAENREVSKAKFVDRLVSQRREDLQHQGGIA